MALCRGLQVLCLPRFLWLALPPILTPTPTAIHLVYLLSMMADTLLSRPSAVSTARRCRPTVPRPRIIPTPPLHPHTSDHHSLSTRRLLPSSRSACLCNNPPHDPNDPFGLESFLPNPTPTSTADRPTKACLSKVACMSSLLPNRAVSTTHSPNTYAKSTCPRCHFRGMEAPAAASGSPISTDMDCRCAPTAQHKASMPSVPTPRTRNICPIMPRSAHPYTLPLTVLQMLPPPTVLQGSRTKQPPLLLPPPMLHPLLLQHHRRLRPPVPLLCVIGSPDLLPTPTPLLRPSTVCADCPTMPKPLP